MLITLNPNSPEPLFAQLASAVRGSVARGELRAGERLPGARDLADSLGLNVHTVLRGYQQLRDEGLVELRRGRGTVVTEQAVGGLAVLRQAVADLTAEARRLGLTTEELVDMIRTEYRRPTRPVAPYGGRSSRPRSFPPWWPPSGRRWESAPCWRRWR